MSKLVIGIGNDADIGKGTNGEELYLQNAGANDLKHYVIKYCELKLSLFEKSFS